VLSANADGLVPDELQLDQRLLVRNIRPRRRSRRPDDAAHEDLIDPHRRPRCELVDSCSVLEEVGRPAASRRGGGIHPPARSSDSTACPIANEPALQLRELVLEGLWIVIALSSNRNARGSLPSALVTRAGEDHLRIVESTSSPST